MSSHRLQCPRLQQLFRADRAGFLCVKPFAPTLCAPPHPFSPSQPPLDPTDPFLTQALLAHAGAGDLFPSGFLYGMLRQYSLQKCCQMGCLAGGAIVQTLGAEMTASNWKWLFDRWAHLAQQPAIMHGTGSFGCSCPTLISTT